VLMTLLVWCVGGGPAFPGGLPGVPPGARFDPYGPPGVPGFEPNRFARYGGRHHDILYSILQQ
ncbi:putative proteasome inhibitor, partial [Sesbania bispinosa]